MLSSNAKTLDLILRRAGRCISRTRLLKIAYMADFYSWRVLGKPISDFRYYRYQQGPFDQAFYVSLEELCESGRAVTEEKTTIAGNDCTLVKACPVSSTFVSEYTRGQIHLVDLAIKRYVTMKLQKLLEAVVYKTEPMVEAAFGQPLPMERQKDKDREAAGGISLETILESREQVSQGKVVSLEELKSEVHRPRR